MYSKPAMKYKYRGHKFDGLSGMSYPLYEYDPNQMKDYGLNTTPNSMLANRQAQSMYIAPAEMLKSDVTSGTSLLANTSLDKTANDNKSSMDLPGIVSSVGSLYAPYAAATNFSNETQSFLLNQASKGKGLYADAYNKIVADEIAKGATKEAAAKTASEQVSSKIASWAGPTAVAAIGIGEAIKGWNADFSGSPYDKNAAKAAAWNIQGDNPLTYNPNVTAWSNLAKNYKDYTQGLRDVNFESNTESQRSLGYEWDNANLLDINKSDLKRGVGRSILDSVVATGKGALMGSAASGNWIGALVGAGVGLGEDIFNKVKAQKQKKEILKGVNDANQRMYLQAQNKDRIIEDLNRQRQMLQFHALGGNLFDQGGSMLTKFDTGGSHEENPLGGIPQGIAPDGQPNLVEQGETKWDDEDYVFSKRLTINKRLAKEYNLPNDFIGKTFAYATEKFNEKFQEHENDAISLATQKAIFSRTREAQEALRADIEMKQLAEQMKNLTPEEQQTLLTQLEQQPMETQQMQYPNGASGMQQMQPMQEMPTMLQDPYGQGQAMVGALGGQFNGGHKFSGLDVLTQYIKDQYPVETEDQINAILNQIKANPEQYVDSWNAYLRNTNNQENLQYLTLLDNLNNLSTADIKQDTKNTETVWEKNYKNRQVVGNTTSDTPQPETIHNLAFQKTISDVFIQKVQDIKDSDKTVAEKRKEIQKLADEWNEYNKLYSELYTISTDKKKSDKEVQAKVKELQTKFNDWGLNAGLTPEIQKQLNTFTVPQGNIAASDNPIDSIYGERTNARYLDARTPELIDAFNSVGVKIGKWDNDEKALHDALTPTVNTKYQTLNPEYNPADPNSPKYLDITVPEAIVDNPDRIKDWLAQEGYIADGSDSTIPEDVFYYKKDTKAPENQAPADNPNLLPTWMRGVGAVLPFMFLNQKSDYSNADMIQAPKIGFTPIADYLKYRPLDKQYYLNSAMARQQNLRNNILNTSGGNRAVATNNLMLADLQAQDELGKLYELAERYNADQRQKVAAQNADVNKFNSQGFFNADQWNAQAEFQARQARAQMRHNIDTATAQANGANLTQGIQNLIGIGDENARLNMINTNPAYAAYLDKLFQVQHKGTPTACGGYLTIKNSKKRR